jgi:hypothetical protein
MKTVPRSRFEVIRLAHPNARITQRDGAEVVIIPTYDVDTDTEGETVLRVVDDHQPPKPRIGELMYDQHGNPFKIVNPASLIPVRKGPVAESE